MLQGVFPQTYSMAIIPAAICQQQQSRGTRVMGMTVFSSPPTQGINGKFCGIP
jgi:hypothetical protein